MSAINSKLLKELNDIRLAAQCQSAGQAELVYEAAIDAINGYNKVITQFHMPGRDGVPPLAAIGDKMIDKISEFLEMGSISVFKIARRSPEFTAYKLFISILGVGPATACKWANINGYRDFLDIKSSDLNRVQALGVKYHKDLIQRIPREEITKFMDPIITKYRKYSDDSNLIIAGSYRRGASSSGDIDALVSGKTSYLVDLVDEMKKMPSFVAILSSGQTRVSLLLKPAGVVRQLDILYAPQSEWAAALLYFTGCAAFNSAMRSWAKNRGYRLNQRGLFTLNDAKEIISVGTFDTEADIFRELGLKYIAPEDRTGADSVVPLDLNSSALY